MLQDIANRLLHEIRETFGCGIGLALGAERSRSSLYNLPPTFDFFFDLSPARAQRRNSGSQIACRGIFESLKLPECRFDRQIIVLAASGQ